MDLPKRTKQQRSEAHSYAILLYKLRELGIFRNLTENDYGIDFELELVVGERITGRTVKIQVKSAEKLKLRADKTPSVGGIKPSTLRYWCELSFRTNVIAYAVDLETETIYVSHDLFWQASAKLDGGTASKSITFRAAGENGDATAALLTIAHAIEPTIADVVYAHTLALRRLDGFLELLGDAYQYDAGSPIHEPERFHDLLETSAILLWMAGPALWSDPADQQNWTKYEHWERKSEEQGWDGLSYHAAQPMLAILVPALVKRLRALKQRVLKGRHFWSYRNPQYLSLVYETVIPEVDDGDGLIAWHADYERNSRGSGMPASLYIAEARKAAAGGKTKSKAKTAAKPKKQAAAEGKKARKKRP